MNQFRVATTAGSGLGSFEIVVSGDVDTATVDDVRRTIETGLASKRPVMVRLNDVGIMGSAATRMLAQMLDRASDERRDLKITGIPIHVRKVFDTLEFDDQRLESADERFAPLPAAVFDSVVASGVLRTRESICITTSNVENPQVVFVNEAFSELTGYTADQMLGENPRLLQGPLSDRSVTERLKRILREGDEFLGETVNYRSDGTPFWMNWRILTIDHGSHGYFMALQRDATELRQLIRYDSARSRLTRLIDRADPPVTRQDVLDALGQAVATIVEPPDVAISAAITDSDGVLIAANLEGSFADPGSFAGARADTFETDDTVTMHFPFAITEDLRGHVLIGGMHPHWTRLTDADHIEQLCRDCVNALRTAAA